MTQQEKVEVVPCASCQDEGSDLYHVQVDGVFIRVGNRAEYPYCVTEPEANSKAAELRGEPKMPRCKGKCGDAECEEAAARSLAGEAERAQSETVTVKVEDCYAMCDSNSGVKQPLQPCCKFCEQWDFTHAASCPLGISLLYRTPSVASAHCNNPHPADEMEFGMAKIVGAYSDFCSNCGQKIIDHAAALSPAQAVAGEPPKREWPKDLDKDAINICYCGHHAIHHKNYLDKCSFCGCKESSTPYQRGETLAAPFSPPSAPEMPVKHRCGYCLEPNDDGQHICERFESDSREAAKRAAASASQAEGGQGVDAAGFLKGIIPGSCCFDTVCDGPGECSSCDRHLEKIVAAMEAYAAEKVRAAHPVSSPEKGRK